MAFGAPWWLVLLPLWPLLLLLARARERRRLRPAPDFLLWQRAAARLPAPASRARLTWRDALLLLPALLFNLGLARPRFTAAAEPEAVLVLVDRSASMAAQDATGRPRIERALTEARRILGSRPHRIEGLPPGPPGTPSRAALDPGALRESTLSAHASGLPVMVVTDVHLPGLPDDAGLVVVSDDARNAGITAAGFDRAAGLLVTVDGDAGAGPRTLTVAAAGGRAIATRRIEDASRFRLVIPPADVPAEGAVTINLSPPDAVPLDDEVILDRTGRAISAALAAPAPAVGRALRAAPGVDVVDGDDPAADLVVGASPRGAAGFALLLPPIAGTGGFETGPPASAEGAFAGTGLFEGLVGPAIMPEVHRLSRRPEGAETLLAIGGAPLLVRHDRVFVLLADPDASGWASVPSFPLTISRIVETVASATGRALEPAHPLASPGETRVARAGASSSRAPEPRSGPAPASEMEAWLYAAGLLAAASVLGAALIARRGDARTRTRPASGRAAAPRRMVRS